MATTPHRELFLICKFEIFDFVNMATSLETITLDYEMLILKT